MISALGWAGLGAGLGGDRVNIGKWNIEIWDIATASQQWPVSAVRCRLPIELSHSDIDTFGKSQLQSFFSNTDRYFEYTSHHSDCGHLWVLCFKKSIDVKMDKLLLPHVTSTMNPEYWNRNAAWSKIQQILPLCRHLRPDLGITFSWPELVYF